MLKRTITGFFILLVLAGFVALRQVNLLFFDAFVLFVMYGCLYEVLRAKKFFYNIPQCVMLFLYPAALAAIYILSSSTLMAFLLQILLVLFYFVILMLTEVISYGVARKNGAKTLDGSGSLEKTKESLLIIAYPLTLLGFLFGLNHLGLYLGYVAIITAFAVTMCCDIFAYLFGRLIKGPKFFPEVSPNKTISGCCFGALGAIGISMVCWVLFVHLGYLGNQLGDLGTLKSVVLFVIIGILGALLTMFGDLVESAIKRKANIKDMGTIFPGHGGFMDRVDGLMFTSALVFILFALFI